MYSFRFINIHLCHPSSLEIFLVEKYLSFKCQSFRSLNHLLNGTVEQLHIPHSDVFYVREAVQNYYGKPFTLEHVEWAMRMEGWTDGGE